MGVNQALATSQGRDRKFKQMFGSAHVFVATPTIAAFRYTSFFFWFVR
jgi:hypothetical protein